MSWKCDSCGEEIQTVDTGWVEWKVQVDGHPPYRKYDFRLVHHGVEGKRCIYDSKAFPRGTSVGDLHLKSFIGQDGLMTLMEFLSDNPSSADEIIELCKRIHITDYDEARGWFNAAINEGVFEPNTKPGFYSIADIKRTVEWARKQGG